MPIRAHRVTEVEYNKGVSFSIPYQDKLLEYLSDKFGFFIMLDDDGVGFGVLPVEALQSALLNVVMTDEVRNHLKLDIEFGKESGWVRYMFYVE